MEHPSWWYIWAKINANLWWYISDPLITKVEDVHLYVTSVRIPLAPHVFLGAHINTYGYGLGVKPFFFWAFFADGLDLGRKVRTPRKCYVTGTSESFDDHANIPLGGSSTAPGPGRGNRSRPSAGGSQRIHHGEDLPAQAVDSIGRCAPPMG